jgi:hypothetical protein
MKEERVVQPPPEIKPRSKTKPQLQKKPPQIKPRQKLKMTETIILSSQGRTHIFQYTSYSNHLFLH